jgi:Tfp pilus assembly protein PilZ
MTLRVELEYDARGETHRAVATTLGAGGLFVATEDPLDVGTALLARFRLAPDGTLHEIAGRVVWNHAKHDDPPTQTCGMGVSFADPAGGAVLAAELETIDAGRRLAGDGGTDAS